MYNAKIIQHQKNDEGILYSQNFSPFYGIFSQSKRSILDSYLQSVFYVLSFPTTILHKVNDSMSIIKISIVAYSYVALAFGMECSKFDTNMGATFDLTDLVRFILSN